MKQGKRETKGHTEKYTKMPFLGGKTGCFKQKQRQGNKKNNKKKQKQKKQKQIK